MDDKAGACESIDLSPFLLFHQDDSIRYQTVRHVEWEANSPFHHSQPRACNPNCRPPTDAEATELQLFSQLHKHRFGREQNSETSASAADQHQADRMHATLGP
jgi:hypothetical protein